MKKFAFITLILTVLLMFSSCNGSHASDLKFFVIARNEIHDSMSSNEIVNTFKNNGRLVFDGEDIMGYNWQNHTVTLFEQAVSSIGTVTVENGGSALFKVDDTYIFALIINNKLIYTGGFQSGTKNPQVPVQPSIKDESRYSFSLHFDSKYSDEKDSRNNQRLYDFLNNHGLLATK